MKLLKIGKTTWRYSRKKPFNIRITKKYRDDEGPYYFIKSFNLLRMKWVK